MGSQWHDGPRWWNDPLSSDIAIFMSTIIPAGFGPINVPFLAAVTQLEGVGYNCLASVPTIPLPLIFPVDVIINGAPQRWFLVAGSFPGGPGTLQPNDYNPSTNARYWVQLA